MARGKIITIEGTDGTGKDTQVDRLVERLKAENIPVYSTTFPNYKSDFGKVLTKYKKGEYKNLDLSVKDVSWVFAADRKIIQPKFDKLVRQGVNIILGRYLESNQAYQGSQLQGAARQEMMDWLERIEIKFLGIRPSDYVLWLDLPVKDTLEALAERKKKSGELVQDIFDDAEKQVHMNRYETYKKLAEQPNWITIPCIKEDENPKRRYTVEELSDMVWELAEKLLIK